MANITVTYSFSNSTTADATQVNQNFTDLINGTSDGTKDFSISALTCAGNATLNGNVTLGNASSKSIIFTGSLASSIPILTHNSFDIGSVTTLGLRSIYFASSGSTKTAKLVAQNNTGDINITLPIRTGTVEVVPTILASQTGTYAILTTDDFIPVSASGGSFTVTLPTAVGAGGKKYIIKRTDQTLANAVTIATTSAQTIDGVTTKKLATQYESWELISDGANWQVISHRIPSVATAYTPTFVGLGTVSSVVATWARRGKYLYGHASLATGTCTAVTASATIPSGLSMDTTVVQGGIDRCGQGNQVSATSTIIPLQDSTNPTLIQFIALANGTNFTAGTGSGNFTNATSFTFEFQIPISGWDD